MNNNFQVCKVKFEHWFLAAAFSDYINERDFNASMPPRGEGKKSLEVTICEASIDYEILAYFAELFHYKEMEIVR